MLIVSAIFLCSIQPTIRLAEEGRSSWVIVAPSSAPLRHGAEELQRYIEAISGAKLPLVESAAGRPAIVVSQDRGLAEEEYWIDARKDRVTIRGGGKRGAIYGCYGLLGDAFGCRWYTPKISFVPKSATLRLGPLHLHGKPAFEYREPYFTEAFSRDWALHNRVNGNSMDLDGSVGGKVSYGRFVHTFSELVPPEQYFKAHPEYFSLVDGKRKDGYAQLCLTNSKVLEIAVAKVEQWIKENPTATIFSVSQNDTYFNCQCEECKKVEKEEGSPAGPLLRFVNKVADRIGKKHPGVLIDTLAYQWSEQPPQHEKPHKNVRIRLAPIGACFAHALDGCSANAKPFANLNAWAKITNQLYIWHYCTDFANYLQPLPDLDEISGDLALFHKRGVVGVFYEGDYAAGGCGDMAELKSYLLARLMWNPEQPAQPIIDEFLKAVYGHASGDIARWLALTHEAAREQNVHATIYDPPTATYFTPNSLSGGETLFEDAEKLVADMPVQLEEVRRARMGLEFVRYAHATDPTDRAAIAKRLGESIRHFGVKETSEGGAADDFLKRIGAF